ncbi:hypothetical protein BH09ACT7_BH09ACT7_48240 [soil metagenome]
MSRTKNLFTASAIVVGSSAALLTGGIAKAEPAPPPNPIMPGINMMEQLIDPAKAPQLLQQATAMLTGLNAAPPAAVPAAAAPSLATASVNLPQTATAALPGMPTAATAALPGMPTAATAALPGMPTAATAALPGMPGALPAATAPVPAGLSTIPGLPVPLPANLPFPTDLSALFPAAGIPAPNLGGTAAPATPGAPALLAPAAPAAPLTGLFPTSALSALP